MPTSKPILGLIGGVGSGKSLVARQFASLGCAVIDADELAREALDSPAVRGELRQWWGSEVLGEDGRVNRRVVAQKVFNSPQELARLEGLIHPQVHAGRERLRGQYLADPAVVAIVEDCPLLLEKGIDAGCDVVVFVDAPRDVRLARVAASRGWAEAELDRREKNQWPLDKKVRRADYVIKNDAGEQECLTQTRRVLSQILHR
ncbi:MAG: dephospho-CoA kinase [Phycisphaeraceae bacterium]|nr:dephospho-CoA kinase [Phycisphaeraceae bacterium]